MKKHWIVMAAVWGLLSGAIVMAGAPGPGEALRAKLEELTREIDIAGKARDEAKAALEKADEKNKIEAIRKYCGYQELLKWREAWVEFLKANPDALGDRQRASKVKNEYFFAHWLSLREKRIKISKILPITERKRASIEGRLAKIRQVLETETDPERKADLEQRIVSDNQEHEKVLKTIAQYRKALEIYPWRMVEAADMMPSPAQAGLVSLRKAEELWRQIQDLMPRLEKAESEFAKLTEKSKALEADIKEVREGVDKAQQPALKKAFRDALNSKLLEQETLGRELLDAEKLKVRYVGESKAYKRQIPKLEAKARKEAGEFKAAMKALE